MTTPETPTTTTKRPTGGWALARHRALAPKRFWDDGIERMEASMSAEHGDVGLGVMTLITYAVQETLSAIGFNVFLAKFALGGGAAVGVPNGMFYLFLFGMAVWAGSVALLSGRLVKTAVKVHTGRDVRALLLRNLAAGFALSVACGAFGITHRDPIGDAFTFLDTHGIPHPDVALVSPIIGVIAVVVWFVLRLPVWHLVIAYGRIVWAWLRELVGRLAT